MAHILQIIQVSASVLLVALILIQRSSGDTGSTFGENSSFLHTRRGGERFLFLLTIIIAVVFAASSIAVIALT
jgi:protein translocase SecG subunit